ncbi:MAG: S-layer homology domain-containing protein [Microcoleaceae cyanobacterium]
MKQFILKLLIKRKSSVQQVGLATFCVVVLNACANSSTGKVLEKFLKADPRLENSSAPASPELAPPSEPPMLTVSLPTDFPSEIPIYPGAQLIEVNSPGQRTAGATTRWQTQDPSNAVQTYYRNQFRDQSWEVTQRPQEEGEGSFKAEKENLRVSVALSTGDTNSSQTEFEVSYQQTELTTTSQPGSTTSPLPLPPNAALPPTASPTSPSPSPTKTPGIANSSENSSANRSSSTANPGTIATVDNTIPPELRQFVTDVAQAGVLTSSQNPKAADDKTLANPNSSITRGEYARWLVNANNNFHAKNPAKQIRLAVASSKPAFTDVPMSHPNFAEIQGLAEAGLLSSSLSGDSTATQFRPDGPLTRENLVLWKVPLDIRKALPKATVDVVKERWGFQDAAEIEAKSLGAVLADFDNGDSANIRRVYGFTTLFQPKKVVTRAEAAAALWNFGFQGDSISAAELAQGKPVSD